MDSQSPENIYSAAKLPDNPGVYFFIGEKGEILYIGRATSLRDRVRSYFGDDLYATRGQLLVDMVSRAIKIEYKETDSVLEAIILEAFEIKKHKPYYNTQEKDDKSWNWVIITDEEFPRVFLERERNLQMGVYYEIKRKFGPYTEGALLREALKIIRKIFPFRDAKANISYNESFYQAIGLSPHINSPEAKKEYNRTIRNLILFFEGKKSELMKTLEKDMKEYAKLQEFEKADKMKQTMYALMHIQDVALIKPEHIPVRKGYRIEAYDIAHMSGKSVVGVMTVVVDNELEKNAYRKFKIIVQKNDDTANLREVLIRRFNHPEWDFPNLIVIDGGLGQKNAAEQLLAEVNLNIPIVSVVKDARHKPDHFLGDEKLIALHNKAILKANAESHRFAIAYHKNLRKRTFFGRK
jgi:excinuclease ABC subunit C